MEGAAAPEKDPKTSLQEWAQSSGRPLPLYTVVGTEGPDHGPTFSVAVRVEGFPEASASGRTKRAAEQAAAAELLRLVRAPADG